MYFTSLHFTSLHFHIIYVTLIYFLRYFTDTHACINKQSDTQTNKQASKQSNKRPNTHTQTHIHAYNACLCTYTHIHLYPPPCPEVRSGVPPGPLELSVLSPEASHGARSPESWDFWALSGALGDCRVDFSEPRRPPNEPRGPQEAPKTV